MNVFSSFRLWALVSGTALCLVLTACGSSSDDADESDSPGAPDVAQVDVVDQKAEVTTSDTSDDGPESNDSDNTRTEDEDPENVEPDDSNTSSTTSTSSPTTTISSDSTDTETRPDPDSAAATSAEVNLTTIVAAFVAPDDVDAAVSCVEREFLREGVAIEQVLESNGIIIAIVRCERDVVRGELFADFAEIDSSAIAATPDQINCTLESFLDFIAELNIADADSVFDSPEPPQALVDSAVDTCGVSVDDALFLLTEA